MTTTPPLVPGLPFVGNSFGLLQDPTRFFLNAYRKYGPVFRVRIPTAPGGEITVMAGPGANVFAGHEGGKYFTTRQYFRHLTRETGTDSYMCALDGDAHTHLRKEMKPGFSRELLAPYVPEMLNLVQKAASHWQPGQRVKAMEFLQRVTIEQLSIFTSNCPIDDTHFEALQTYANTFVGAGVALRPTILFHLPTYTQAKYRFESFLKEHLTRHKATVPDGSRHLDMMDVVLGGHYGDGTPFAEADLVANAHLTYVNGLVYAGRICGYMLYALLKNKPLLEQLTAEIDAALAMGHLTIQGLRHLKFLRAVLLEAIRLYPIAGAAPRYVTQSFEYGGCRIEAGSTVFVAITVPHFMPEIYTDPFTFDPERFMEPRNEHHYPGAFHPYGLGQHTCISINVVETVVMTTIIGLLSGVRLELDPPNYAMRTVINPVPGPDAKFAFRVTEQRTPVIVPQPADRPVFTSYVIEHHDGLQVKTDFHTFAPGETIIEQSETADHFYVLLKGKVDVLKAQPGQSPRRVAVLAPPSYFGEIGLLSTVKRTATVRVADDSEPVELLSLDWHTFMYLVSHYDLTSAEIMELVIQQQASSEV